MKVVAILGSPRLEGNTSYLVDQALDEVRKSGIATERIALNRLGISPCQAHDECASVPSCLVQDDAEKVLDSFVSADGVILASPVYFENVSAQMKLFIDRCRFLRRHKISPRAKSMGLIAVAATVGVEDAVSALKRFLGSLDGLSPDEALCVVGHARDAGQIGADEAVVSQARQLGARMAEQLLSEESASTG